MEALSIKFCLNYKKLMGQKQAMLLDVKDNIDYNDLDKQFIEYDTYNGAENTKFLLNPNKKYMLLTFLGDKNVPFTTLREYDELQSFYYKDNIKHWYDIQIVKSRYQATYLSIENINYTDNITYNKAFYYIPLYTNSDTKIDDNNKYCNITIYKNKKKVDIIYLKEYNANNYPSSLYLLSIFDTKFENIEYKVFDDIKKLYDLPYCIIRQKYR